MLLATKLKNEIHNRNCMLVCSFKNISVNGQKRGCSGFVVNPDTQKCVYVNTESICYGPLSNQSMWRYAKNTHDYTGEQNHWCSPADLAATVVEAVTKDA